MKKEIVSTKELISFDLCMYPKVSKNDNAGYIYRILLPLIQKAGREAFDNVDPLFAGL